MAQFSHAINHPKKRLFCAIGLMSGTSMDGIDIAYIETDGVRVGKIKKFATFPYRAAFRKKLAGGLGKIKAPKLERELTLLHARAVKTFLALHKINKADIDVIGFHGHTLLHEPHKKRTVQISDGKLLAKRTGIPVIFDFRSDDVRAGGQGAPLVPVYHEALAVKWKKPVVFLNIGGVANITFVGDKGELLACDTGTGNALIDDWAQTRIGKAFDKDGKLAALGMADKAWVQKFLRHAYFKKKMPKSLDRDAFKAFVPNHLVAPDGAATLTMMSVAGIAKAIADLPKKPHEIIVCGGGRRNKEMMRLLKQHVPFTVTCMEKKKMNGDAIEAEAFAYMAVREIQGLPISFKGTTGRR